MKCAAWQHDHILVRTQASQRIIYANRSRKTGSVEGRILMAYTTALPNGTRGCQAGTSLTHPSNDKFGGRERSMTNNSREAAHNCGFDCTRRRTEHSPSAILAGRNLHST